MTSFYSILNRLQKMKLVVRGKKRGIHSGSRSSNRFGSSVEFSDFRLYHPGDDVRQIDWNVYGRTQKHYIKRYLDERELSIAIYLDMTSSMRQIETKWELAKQIAAALSFSVLANEDRLIFTPVGTSSLHPIRRKGAAISRKTFLEILEMEEPEQTGHFIQTMSQSLSKNQQLSILITDGLEPLEEMEVLLKKISSLKQEIWFIQVLSEEEVSPTYAGDLKLIDSESSSSVNVSMNPAVAAGYEKRINEHNQKLERLCKQFGGSYLPITDRQTVQSFLFSTLLKRGFLR